MTGRVRALLTLLFFALLSLSCREGSTTPSAPTSISFSLSFSVGDRFLYDTWVINEYGYLLQSTKSTSTWRVRDTGLTFRGRQHATFIIDSIRSAKDTTVVLDSIYLAVDPNGDVYRYGFLSGIAASRTKRILPRQWDCIAAFSLGMGAIWEIGAWDSAGVERVFGQIRSAQELFAVKVNGVQTVFPGYRVDLQSSSISYSFSLSNAPPAVLDIDDEPALGLTGTYRELREIVSKK
jgi:hypothetical protein